MEEMEAGCPLGAKCEEVKVVEGRQVLFRCPWHIKVKGKDPQSEKEIDMYACAIAWMPTLMINTAQEVSQGAAAVESFRNEVVRRQDQLTTRTMSFPALDYPGVQLIQEVK